METNETMPREAPEARTPKGNGAVRGLELGLARLLRQQARNLMKRQPRTGNGLELSSPFVGWQPPCNVSETDTQYRIEVELPQTQRHQIDVTATARQLTIRGERKRSTSKKIRDLHVESVYGAFQRSLELPVDADVSSIEASFANGVLTLAVAKQPLTDGPPARKIEVA